jgi:hypothetical protein
VKTKEVIYDYDGKLGEFSEDKQVINLPRLPEGFTYKDKQGVPYVCNSYGNYLFPAPAIDGLTSREVKGLLQHFFKN